MSRLYLSSLYQWLLKRKFEKLDRLGSRNVNTQCISQARLSNSFCIEWSIFQSTLEYEQYRNYATASYLSGQNVFKSIMPDITNYHGLFVHEVIWENATKWWSKTALVCARTGRSYTYEQLRRLSGKFATSLRKNNIEPGDTIAVILPNIPEYGIAVLGSSEAGVKITLVNSNYTAEEINKQLNDSEAVAVITVPNKYLTVQESICNNPAIRVPVIIIEDGIGSAQSGTINFRDLLANNVEEFEQIGLKTEKDRAFDTFVLPYSSGTTGLPKGVEITHRNIVALFFQLQFKEVVSTQMASNDYQEIIPVFLPMFHVYGFVGCLLFHLFVGAKIVCMPTFSSTNLLDTLEKYQVTILCSPPPVIQLIANDERFTRRHTEHLHSLISGAAPLKIQFLDKLFERCGTHFIFTQPYGLTESTAVITKSVKAPFTSCGKLIPNTQARIVGIESIKKGMNLGPNECGELYVRGPQMMKGYFKNDQANRESMDGNWLKTGDLGMFDSEGFLYIQGRLKEQIKVQGYQVAPTELENIIQQHSKVADVAVIGVPHDKYGEIPKAFIVPKQNMQIDEQEIKNFVSQQVVKYKQLGHVVMINQNPKNAAGKILRNALK